VSAPEGFRYVPEFLGEAEERDLLEKIRPLDFEEVRMHGIAAKRRTAHFGWLYAYDSARIQPGPPLPDFLRDVRARAAALIDVHPETLEEVLITRYPAGAGIGWHRDAPAFGPAVIGVSLGSPCRMRFQRGEGERRRTFAAVLEPRSAYVLAGPARSAWQHSIPKTPAERYSVTFRSLAAGGVGRELPARGPRRAPTRTD
jgi:alkylated DNA repair dioxygenase AlkB